MHSSARYSGQSCRGDKNRLLASTVVCNDEFFDIFWDSQNLRIIDRMETYHIGVVVMSFNKLVSLVVLRLTLLIRSSLKAIDYFLNSR